MKSLTIRLDDDVAQELQSLSEVLGASKNSIVNLLIRQEYNKYHEDPKIMKALEQMAELRAVFERFNAENEALN